MHSCRRFSVSYRARPGDRSAWSAFQAFRCGLTPVLVILAMAVALPAGETLAQTLAAPDFELPGVPAGVDGDRYAPRNRLLQLIRDRAWVEAAQLAAKATQAEETDPQLHYLVGVVLWQQEDKVGAIQHFRTAERLGLREPYLHKALGVAYYDAHQFELFKQQMERASAADQSDPQPHLYLGRYTESVRGDFAGALRHFKRVIELDPTHAEGYFYLAYCLERLDQWEAARKNYRTSAALLEQNGLRLSWPYQGLARLSMDTEPRSATEWARKAVQSGLDDFQAHALLARSHERNGSLPEAIAAAREAVRLNPDHAASHYLLFTAYRRLGDTDAAQRHLSRFQELKRIYGDQ